MIIITIVGVESVSKRFVESKADDTSPTSLPAAFSMLWPHILPHEQTSYHFNGRIWQIYCRYQESVTNIH